MAEENLKNIAKNRGKEFEIGLGEAALYGPKIDFIAKDSLGRDWQVATIQLDFNQPERFDLNFINDQGQKEKIRASLDDAKESVGKKIRNAQLQKIPYMIVFGDKEAKSNNLFIKERGKEKVSKTTRQAFIKKLKKQIKKRK